jgi:hypothetical protein
MDIYYTQNKVIPTLEEYEKMMVYKTGYAFIMNLELLMDKSTNIIFRKNYEKVKHILILFSLFFQIRDDYINLTDLNYWKEKGFCQDFDEEKISYLITYFHNENIKNNNPSANPYITNTNITDTNITDTNITDTNITDTNITDTNITDTNITDTNITDTNITNTNIIEMMKDKSKEGKIKILQIYHKTGLFNAIYNKILQLKEAILSEMNFEFIFEQLSVKPFDINDIEKFLKCL